MPNILTERFEEALIYAARLHAEQKRKRSSVPYLAHLLGVTSLVLEDGGGENEAIAALLHDAVEDQGGSSHAGSRWPTVPVPRAVPIQPSGAANR